MKRQDIKIIDNIKIQAIDNKTGKVKKEVTVHNIVVANGKSRIANLINGGSSSVFDYIAIGTDNTSETVNDTALGSEVTRESATISEDPTGTAKWTKTFTFGSGESYTITEAGVFDQATASGSTMMNRATFSGIPVDSDTDLSITVTLGVDNCA